MSVLTDSPAPSTEPLARPSARLASPVVAIDGSLAALHRRRAIVAGRLRERTEVVGTHLVVASAVPGGVRSGPSSWWIPAAAVWSDGDDSQRPECPRPIGLAAAPTPTAAALAGLSDRLGWEAAMELEREGHLPAVGPREAADVDLGRDVVVHDGRLGHDVPTVVIAGPGLLRWGAGDTWTAAIHRALFGDAFVADGTGELDAVVDLLTADHLVPAVVDLGTTVLQRLGIVRSSVQLTLAG